MARAIEADAAAIVEQHLWEAYGEEVRAIYRPFRELVDRQHRVRTLQEHARREFPHRTVLPHVEPIARFLHPGQAVGLEDLFYLWEHDRDVQALLGGSA